MNFEKWYTFTADDWKTLEEQFQTSYFPVLRFITENKGSFSEARDVYIDAFYYYTRTIELKGKSYLDKSTGLIYSFSRIIWLKKLLKRNVDTNLVRHQREYFDLDHAYHEIDLMNERSAKAASKLAQIGEPCRTMMFELIGKGKSFEEVGPRLGFSVEERAIDQLSGCVRKLVELAENKTFDLSNDDYNKCLNYVISPEGNQKPSGKEMDICLAMTSRVVATVKNHVSSKERTAILREFKERLLPDDADNLRKMESTPKRSKMKPLQLLSITALVAIIVSGLTSFGLYNFSNGKESTVPPLAIDTAKVDTVMPTPAPEWQERSAFLINQDGFALTSSQDLSKGDRVDVSSSLSKSGGAEVIALDESTGLALLKVDSAFRSEVPFRFAQSPSEVGDGLISLGYSQGTLLFAKATTQLSDQQSLRISGTDLVLGAPLFSEFGEFKGIVIESEEGIRSCGVEKVKDFIEYAVAEDVQLPKRNKLFYNSTAEKVERLKPCILKIRFAVSI